MKCFECGMKCVTNYIMTNNRITAVNKVCPGCDWKSHPTKIPDPIR